VDGSGMAERAGVEVSARSRLEFTSATDQVPAKGFTKPGVSTENLSAEKPLMPPVVARNVNGQRVAGVVRVEGVVGRGVLSPGMDDAVSREPAVRGGVARGGRGSVQRKMN